jgi:hypothetical protein
MKSAANLQELFFAIGNEFKRMVEDALAAEREKIRLSLQLVRNGERGPAGPRGPQGPQGDPGDPTLLRQMIREEVAAVLSSFAERTSAMLQLRDLEHERFIAEMHLRYLARDNPQLPLTSPELRPYVEQIAALDAKITPLQNKIRQQGNGLHS